MHAIPAHPGRTARGAGPGCPVGSVVSVVLTALLAGAVLTACASGASTGSASTTAPSVPGAHLVTATCPSTPPDGMALASPEAPMRSGLATELVPAGPTVATVCRYSGVGSTGYAGSLVTSRVFRGQALDSLTSFLDSSRWVVIAAPATYNCPEWNGGQDVGLFSYSHGPGVRVDVDVGGCGFASNGVRTVEGDAIAQHLAAMAGS